MCGSHVSQDVLFNLYNVVPRSFVDVLEFIVFGAAPIGAGLSLIASIFVLPNARKYISMVMIAILLFSAFVITNDRILNLIDFGSSRFLVLDFSGAGIVTFMFLGLISLIYWPTQKRWVNRPLVFGIGLSVAAVLPLILFT